MQFASVGDKFSFPEEEQRILQYWKEIDAFETSLKQSEGKKEFTFYDGPPFATGLPHYGHILAGTIKDVVTRYAHQTGHHVTRRFGWDTHGLPVEFEIDKKLGITSKEDVAAMGIDRYNAECRAIVQRYSKEWETIVNRMGRWIDFKNDYKTMDPNFMESVWWVFKAMHKKGLVYKGYKVMPYSTACTTPLANFEAGLNYKDVRDPAVVVSFPVYPNKEFAFLAWTTTPWTLPSNLGLCVHPEMDYVKVRDKASQDIYVLAKARLQFVYPAKKGKKNSKEKQYEMIEEMKGKDLKGLRYYPLFDYFAEKGETGSFRVMNDTYVTSDSGTGIVHQAPAFGEDDYRVCLQHDVIQRGGDIVCPVDDNGNFTAAVTDFAGRYVKEADRDIIRMLKTKKRLIKDDQHNHSYPHCWRSDTPLIYKVVPSWFVNVPAIRDKLLVNNKKTSWVPAFVQEKRFHNWLVDARDWAVSRNRYWGTPLPIWISDDGEEYVVIGSIQELKDLSGVQDITDLHKDKIDHITIPSKQGKGLLRRVPEVFDCWFESGSMPYAQQHYPFENKEKFERGFPADFIAEGLDQTRGWFYTLMVISTALFDEPAFKNLIVNGLVLAADGKKMSKRLKNYPDPSLVVNANGADALRLYLINSPVVRAEPLAFKEEGVRDVVRKIFIPWYGVYCFFVAQARRVEQETKQQFVPDENVHKHTDNIMNKWILSSLQTLIKNVREEMAGYRLYTVIPHLLKFVDQLSRWYLRFNKGHLKGDMGSKQCQHALATLFKVLYECCRLMAPFTPFLVESMYLNLRNGYKGDKRSDSVHYLMVPEVDESAIDTDVERSVANMQAIVELGRQARDKSGINFRIPCPEVTVFDSNEQTLADLKSLEDYIKDPSSLNCKKLTLSTEGSQYIKLCLTPNRRALGRRLGKKAPEVFKFLSSLSHEEVSEFASTGSVSVEVNGEKLTVDISEVDILKEFVGDTTLLEAQSSGSTLLVMNKQLDDACKQEGIVREVMSRVQQLRKKAGVSVEDKVDAWYKTDSKSLSTSITDMAEYITAGIRVTLRPYSDVGSAALIGSDESSIEGDALTVFLTAAASPSKQTTSKPKKKSNKKKKKSNKKKKKKAAPVVDNEKLIKAAIKEGGKKGQDIAGLSEMGGVSFFHVSMDSAEGDHALMAKCLEGFNKEVEEGAEDRKGGAGHLGKMLFSYKGSKLVFLCHVPNVLKEKEARADIKTWFDIVLKVTGGKVVSESAEVMTGEAHFDASKGQFPIKIRDDAICKGYEWLQSMQLVLPDDDDDDIVYGDDDFPDYYGEEETKVEAAAPAASQLFAGIDAGKTTGQEQFLTYDDDVCHGKPFPPMGKLEYLNLDDYAKPKPGQVRVVVVWGQYHKPGYKFLPLYSQLQAKYGDKVSVVGVSVDPDTSYPKKFLDDPAKKYSTVFETKFAIAWDNGALKKALIKVGGLATLSPPYAYVLNGNGSIVWHQDHSELGATAPTYLGLMEEQIDAVLAGTPLKKVGDRAVEELESEGEEVIDVQMDGDMDDGFGFL